MLLYHRMESDSIPLDTEIFGHGPTAGRGYLISDRPNKIDFLCLFNRTDTLSGGIIRSRAAFLGKPDAEDPATTVVQVIKTR